MRFGACTAVLGATTPSGPEAVAGAGVGVEFIGAEGDGATVLSAVGRRRSLVVVNERYGAVAMGVDTPARRRLWTKLIRHAMTMRVNTSATNLWSIYSYPQ